MKCWMTWVLWNDYCGESRKPFLQADKREFVGANRPRVPAIRVEDLMSRVFGTKKEGQDGRDEQTDKHPREKIADSDEQTGKCRHGFFAACPEQSKVVRSAWHVYKLHGSLSLGDAGEGKGMNKRLLLSGMFTLTCRCGNEDAHNEIAAALWDAHSDGDALQMLHKLTSQLPAWESAEAEGDRASSGHEQDRGGGNRRQSTRRSSGGDDGVQG